MRAIRLIPLIAVLALVGVVKADILDDLISRGNKAYEMSQRTRIKECADSLVDLIISRNLTGDSLKDFNVGAFKLYGNYYYEKADFDSAAYYYDRVAEIIRENPETSFHGNELLMPREQAQLYYRLGRYDMAVEVLADVVDELDFNQPYLPGSDDWLITKLTYAISLARTGKLDEAVSLAEEELANATDTTSLGYAKAERMYAKILLLADADRQGALKAYKDYFARQKRFALTNFSRMTAKEREEYWQTLYPFITDCYRLGATDPDFLYDVALFSKGLLLQLERLDGDAAASDSALGTLGYAFTDIRKKLAKGEAAIEFIEYEDGGERKMAALVLKDRGNVSFVPVATAAEVQSIGGRVLNSTSGTGKSMLYRKEQLHSAVWNDVLMEQLADVKSIYFAPDGYLHRLAIEYFPQMADRQLYRLTSTRRLMESRRPYENDAPMLLVGNVNYDLDKAEGEPLGNDSEAFRRFTGYLFPKLGEDTDETAPIYVMRANPADCLLSKSAASEYAFRTLAPEFGSIIVSTHGEFNSENPVATDVKEVYDSESLSENIIAFAGVNRHLEDAPDRYDRYCDGLLSASELASLDLGNCRLFTVSACQSGLGHITPDGVFGLQRGLKKAGVDAIIVSLWNVNSEATGLLMTHLYKNMAEGMPVREAFLAARKSLMLGEEVETSSEEDLYKFDPAVMASRRQSGNIPGLGRDYSSPQYTDAFILIDAL